MYDEGKCIISGFQSPIEKDVSRLVLKGTQPIILVLARGMCKRQVMMELSQAVQQGIILIMSPFKENATRITEETALIRNRYMFEKADDFCIPFYSKGGLIEQAIRTSKYMESSVP